MIQEALRARGWLHVAAGSGGPVKTRKVGRGSPEVRSEGRPKTESASRSSDSVVVDATELEFVVFGDVPCALFRPPLVDLSQRSSVDLSPQHVPKLSGAVLRGAPVGTEGMGQLHRHHEEQPFPDLLDEPRHLAPHLHRDDLHLPLVLHRFPHTSS